MHPAIRPPTEQETRLRDKATAFLSRLPNPEAACGRRNLKGRPGTSTACVLALLLASEFPGQPWGVGGGIFYALGWPPLFAGRLPPACVAFADAYDGLKFPDLVEAP